MEHQFSNLDAEGVKALAATILVAFVPVLPQPDDDDDSREYQYTNHETGRDFNVTRDEGFVDGSDKPQTRYFLYEFRPNGVVVEGKNAERSWEAPRYKEFDQKYGPNGVRNALRQSGVDTDKLFCSGGGYGVGTIFRSSLEECAQAVAEALFRNEWYAHFRQLSDPEQVKLDRRSAIDSYHFWKDERAAMDRALATEQGIFKGCFTMMGRPVSDDHKKAILSYLNKPSQETWLDIRGYIVTGKGTLWQAWCEHDANAPRAGNSGFPTKDELTEAIRAAVRRRDEEINERLKETSPVGLRSV